MNKTLIFVLKFVSSMIAFAIALDLFFDATFADIVSFSLLVTVMSYMLGDRIILPRLGNRNALIADFFLVYASVWVFGSVLLNSYLQIAWGSVIAAGIITLSEVFIHRYILKTAASNHQNNRKEAALNPRLAYGMEMAEEKEPTRDWD
ncbi:YndM family protein [Bacillus sp. CMF12]|uniref:YndM family protein n=1 Tax=Bacillaceae TaxID=186817 RepID=UPI001FB3E086|nr:MULTISPECIES: YndM family protein [Bacillaceae]UOE57658.1 YndM family protein [Cytobacillus oceanisediminis]USK52123.1 YndM family protein [Bacillus sp. CMF12]